MLNARQRFRSLAFSQGPLAARVGWATLGHVGVQVIRFGTNLVLTRLLAPELFGIMVLLMSLRVAMELLSDIGVTQNIVSSPDAERPAFYNTAWTIQVLRGFFLAAIAIAVVPVFERFYQQEELNQVLPFVSLFFIIVGLHSVSVPLTLKALDTKKIAKLEFFGSIVGAAAMILAAVLAPNVWGLLIGNLAATSLGTIFSYLIRRDLKHRFTLNREYAKQIVGLGKWIFASSVIYFLATNFDRLILAKYVTFTALGLYGLARSLGDVVGQLASKLGSAIIFPGVASSGLEGSDLRAKLGGRRAQFLFLSSLAVAALVAGSDLIIRILYDDRYLGAADLLPWIGLAAWLGILNTLHESVLMGLRKPAFMTLGNAAKFVCILAALPLLVVQLGVVGAAIATLLGEFARWLALSFGKFKVGVGFIMQDLVATFSLLAAIVTLRVALHSLELTGALNELLVLS